MAEDNLVHIPPNSEGSTAASGANQDTPKPKRSHAYNRRCQEIVLQAGYFKMSCNRPTKRGNLYCEKHRGKE